MFDVVEYMLGFGLQKLNTIKPNVNNFYLSAGFSIGSTIFYTI